MADHLPARHLDDISLDDKNYKADFELTSRFQAFSGELLRLSLLGIGVYGFMLVHTGSDTGFAARILARTIQYKDWIAFSIFAFGIASAASLAHGFLATKCLAFQVQILKQLKRLEGGHWNAKDEIGIKADLGKLQGKQKLVLKVGLHCLLTAVIALAAGAVSVSYAFAAALFSSAK